MDDMMKKEASINVEEDGVLRIMIPLKGGNPVDQEITAYGVLAKAEKVVFQFYAMEEMRHKRLQESLKVIRPA